MSPSTSETPTEPAFQQRFERSRGVLLAPLAVALAIAAWVGLVQLGGSDPRGAGPSGSPAATVVAVGSAAPSRSARPTPQPTPEPTPRPTQAPVLQLFGPPLEGRVLVSDLGLRHVDLGTGQLGPHVGLAGELGRMLALPDGTFACVCVHEEAAGPERAFIATLATLDERGNTVAESPVGRWVGTEEAGLAADIQPFGLDAAHSPDGQFVAVTVSVLRPPAWQRQLLLVDVATGRVTSTVELPSAPSSEVEPGRPLSSSARPRPAEPRWAWAPTARFALDGRHVVVSGLVVDDFSTPEAHGSWVLAIEAGVLTDLVALPMHEPGPAGGDACRDAIPEFAGDGMVAAICWGDALLGPFIRRVTVSGERLPDVSLRAALKDAAAPSSVGDGRGNLWLWDPWASRAVHVDLVEGRIGPVSAIGRGGIQARLLGPGLVLTPDRRHLVVAAGEPEVGNGLGATRILVLDIETLQAIRDWAVDPEVFSLAVSDDGEQLYVAHLPGWDDSGNPVTDARLSVFDLQTGALRAVLGRLGSEGFMLLGRTDQGT